MDARINDFCSGHLLLLWEEDDTEPMDLDEGYITLGNTNSYLWFVSAGKLYIPFGNYESSMISDPLTLEIGETSESAVLIGFEYQRVATSIAIYKGDIIENGKDDKINAVCASVKYGMEKNKLSIDVGADMTNHMMDSNGLGDVFAEKQNAFMENNAGGTYALKDLVAGYAVHAIIGIGSVCLTGEYVSALDDLEFITDDGAESTVIEIMKAPKAFHIEGSYNFEIMEKPVTFALSWQGTDNLGGILSKNKFGGTIGVSLSDCVFTAVEYIRSSDYEKDNYGTDENADTFTIQLAVEF